MKIESLVIKNFRGLDEVMLVDLDKSVNLFVGANGAGKSSVLDSISILMSWALARLINPRHGVGTHIPLSDIRLGESSGCRLAVDTDQFGAWSLFRTRAKNASGKSDLASLMAHVKLFANSYDENPSMPLPIFVHYKVNRSVTEVPLRARHTKESGRMQQIWGNAYGSASFKEFFYWYREQEDLENERIRRDPAYRLRSLESIRQAFDICFPGYHDLHIKRSPTSMLVNKDGITLNIGQLSDGEKCYIALVCDICRRLAIADPTGDILKGSGIVLVDEIDLHLHPEWQLQVVSRLVRTFPNLQFFFSTHSSLVPSDIKGKVYVIKEGTVMEADDTTFGKDSSQLLASLFGVYAQRSPEMQALIDSAYQRLREHDFEQFSVIFKEISRLLGDNDIEVLNLNIEKARRLKQSAQ